MNVIKPSLVTFALLASINPVLAQERDCQSEAFVDAGRGFDATIDVSEDESITTFKLSGWLAPNSANGGSRNDLTWSIAAAYPIGGADDITDSSVLDRLRGGPKLSVAINLLSYQGGGAKLESSEFQRVFAEAKEACRLKAQSGEAGAPTAAECDAARPSERFVTTYRPNAELRMNRALYSGYWSFGLQGSIGSDKYDFVTPGTLAAGERRMTAYAATLGIGYYLPDAVTAIKFAAEYSSGAEDLDKQVVCKTVVVTPADDCKFALPRAPGREEALVLRGEVRRFFPFSNGKGGIGAALTGSVDTLSGDYGVELPIYLSLPGDTPVLPGITFKYNSDEDDFSVGIFLKTVFKF